MFRALAFLFLLCLAGPRPAEASLWGQALEECQSWFGKLRRGEEIPPEERALFRAAFEAGGSHPYSAEANLDTDLFYAGFLRLPNPIRHRLLNLPGNISPYRAAEELELDLSSRSFLDQVLKKLDREGPEALRRKLAQYEERLASGSFREAQARAWDLSRGRSHALAIWDAHAGEVVLRLEEKNGRGFLRVGSDEYPARQEGNSIFLEVPREKVAHPFWNPVAPEKVMVMARAGVRPPSRFETLLGHDGKFYLVDGNHRFQLDTRKIVPVEIAGPHTVNLRAMLDLIGVPQPKDPDLITRYVNGEISWEKLVPLEKRRSFVIPPSLPDR